MQERPRWPELSHSFSSWPLAGFVPNFPWRQLPNHANMTSRLARPLSYKPSQRFRSLSEPIPLSSMDRLSTGGMSHEQAGRVGAGDGSFWS